MKVNTPLTADQLASKVRFWGSSACHNQHGRIDTFYPDGSHFTGWSPKEAVVMVPRPPEMCEIKPDWMAVANILVERSNQQSEVEINVELRDNVAGNGAINFKVGGPDRVHYAMMRSVDRSEDTEYVSPFDPTDPVFHQD
jgi:hypothetical protein